MSRLPPIPSRYYDEEQWHEFHSPVDPLDHDPDDRIAFDREDDEQWDNTRRGTDAR